MKIAATGVSVRLSPKPDPGGIALVGWVPVIVGPAAAIAARPLLAPWCFMWTLAAAIFFGCKWQSWWQVRTISGGTLSRSVGFLFGWPGMDAAAFLDPEHHAQRPVLKEWSWAIAKTAFGVLLLWGVPRRIPASRELLTGWVGMLGIILVMHFGTFHILSLLWRSAGVDARPIMQAPLSATSLSDFWGRRWNLGFRQLTYRLIFQPVRSRSGVATATLLSFFASGLIHELVISLPARGGYGLPTCYFVLQGLGVLFERSMPGKRLGLSSGTRGWLFAVICAGAPAYLLFHPWFARGVILPFLSAIGAR
ncbi:MAG: MBOAT family protein [Candidatus Acidiferrales bacterium]